MVIENVVGVVFFHYHQLLRNFCSNLKKKSISSSLCLNLESKPKKKKRKKNNIDDMKTNYNRNCLISNEHGIKHHLVQGAKCVKIIKYALFQGEMLAK